MAVSRLTSIFTKSGRVLCGSPHTPVASTHLQFLISCSMQAIKKRRVGKDQHVTANVTIQPIGKRLGHIQQHRESLWPPVITDIM